MLIGLCLHQSNARAGIDLNLADFTDADFGVVRDLPLGRVTTVEVTPPAAGEYPFHCGMNMVRGTLVAT